MQKSIPSLLSMRCSGDNMRRKAIIPLAFVLMLCIAPIPVLANSNTLAYTGTAGPDSSTGDYTDTWVGLGQYLGIKDTAGEAYVILNFSIAPDTYLTSFNYSCNGGSAGDDDGVAEIWVYDWNAHDWAYADDLYQGYNAWANGSISGSQYSGDSQITLKFNSTDSDGEARLAVYVAWLHNIDSEGWNTVGDAIVRFSTGLYMAPINGLIIFLGLIMIPTSAMYLVRGGRKELSMDKFFFVLVIFFVGWALLIGGIMP